MRILAVLLLLTQFVLHADEKRRPREPKRQAEIALRLIEAGSLTSLPNDAATLVPQELKTLLTFTRYHLLDSGFIRGLEDEDLTLTLAGDLRCEITFRYRSGSAPTLLEYDVQIYGIGGAKGQSTKLLETSATAKSDETIVLGASRMKDSSKALIVLLTGKLLP